MNRAARMVQMARKKMESQTGKALQPTGEPLSSKQLNSSMLPIATLGEKVESWLANLPKERVQMLDNKPRLGLYKTSAVTETPSLEASEATLHQEAADVTPHQEAADITPPQEAADITLPQVAADITLPQVAADITLPQEAADITPPQEAANITPPQEAADITPPQEAADITPHQHAADVTPLEEAADVTPLRGFYQLLDINSSSEISAMDLSLEIGQGGKVTAVYMGDQILPVIYEETDFPIQYDSIHAEIQHEAMFEDVVQQVGITSGDDNGVIIRGDEVILNENEQAEFNKHCSTRKRRRRMPLWKRNIEKEKRLRGEAYVMKNGRAVEAKEAMINKQLCSEKCRLKCNDSFSEEDRVAVFQKYYSLSLEARNAYLFGNIETSRPQCMMLNTNKHRNITARYKVNQVRCCKKAFMNLHAITQSKVDHLVGQAKAGEITVRPSMKGKHKIRPNKISEERINKVKEHIALFPAERSHYSRTQNPNRMYLSPTLTIEEMHAQYKIWIETTNVQPVSSCMYRNIFCNEFNLGFGTPRSDTCSRCDSGIMSETHNKNADDAFEQQRKDRALAKEEPGIHYITFDMEKTLPLPRLSVGDAFYLRQIWLYNTGIHVINKDIEGAYFHIWTEDEGHRGVREVVSSLMSFLRVSKISEGKLIAWSDSCAGQNKNYLMICFWQYLIARNVFACIEHKFPEPGHSYLDSDRDFGRVEKAVKARENIYSPDQYYDIMANSAKKPKPIVSRIGDKMYDASSIPTILGIDHRPKPVNTMGDKIEMRDKVRWIRVTKLGFYEYKHSLQEDEVWKEVDIRQRNHAIVAEKTIPELGVQPPTALGIKKAKLSDIRKQMRYIPDAYQGFYKKQLEMDSEEQEEQETDEDTDPIETNALVSIGSVSSSVLPEHPENVEPSLMHRNVMHARRAANRSRSSIIPAETLTSRTNVTAKRPTKRSRSSIIPAETLTSRTNVTAKRATKRSCSSIIPAETLTSRTNVTAKRPTKRSCSSIIPAETLTSQINITAKRATKRSCSSVIPAESATSQIRVPIAAERFHRK